MMLAAAGRFAESSKVLECNSWRLLCRAGQRWYLSSAGQALCCCLRVKGSVPSLFEGCCITSSLLGL
jgi:hypothetical protein